MKHIKPKRIQRKRTKGWRMPANTVCVSRGTKWGNPFRMSDYKFDSSKWTARVLSKMQSFNAVRDFQDALKNGSLGFDKEDVHVELRGKNLACWCRLDQKCHADVLLEIANK